MAKSSGKRRASTPKKRKAVSSDKRRTATPKSTDPTVRHILDNGLGSAVAAACGIRRQAVPQWKVVPARHVITVAQIIGIPRHKIRPDVFLNDDIKRNRARIVKRSLTARATRAEAT